jgi:peptidoglycan/LPS O-acetylase OafA/YrhL
MSASGAPVALGYRPDIDGLRAVAVIAVVASHVGLPGFSGGFVGVDVFFVISGFLITGVLVADVERFGQPRLAEFYARRARRILPGLLLLIVACLAFAPWLAFSSEAWDRLLDSASASLAFVANHHFWHQGNDYFAAERGPAVLLHLWSLGVEEQFYLIFPLLLLLLARLGDPTRARRRIVIVLFCGTTVSVGICSFLTWRHGAAAFYLAPSRAWEIGVGAIVWVVVSRGLSLSRRHAAIIALAGVLLLVTGFAFIVPQSRFPAPWAGVPVLGTALIIGAGAVGPDSAVTRLLAVRPLVAIGNVSYAWYLWHWPILVGARQWLLFERNTSADVAAVLAALALAALTTAVIERPARHVPVRTRVNQSRILALSASAVVTLLVVTRYYLAERGPTAKDADLRIAAPTDDCSKARLARGRLAFGTCTAHRAMEPPDVLLWGDSHAFAWGAMVRLLAERHGDDAAQMWSAGCPPLLGIAPSDPDAPGIVYGGLACRDVNAAVASYLPQAAHHGLKMLVLASRWARYSGQPTLAGDSRRTYNPGDTTPGAPMRSMENALNRTLHVADSLHLRVLILLSPPEFPVPVPLCVRIRGAAACSVSRTLNEAYRQQSTAVIRSVASHYSRVEVFDPLPYFCRNGTCPPLYHGKPVLIDRHHLAAGAALAMAGYVSPVFERLMTAETPRP